MKKNKYLPILGFALVLFVISFTLGYQLMKNKVEDDKILSNENIVDNNLEGMEIIKEENRISPNTLIEERVHYKKCDHLISGIHPSEGEIINMTREEYEEHLRTNYPNLRLVSFSNTKIVLWGERNHLCQNHYIIGEENGKIAVFTIGEEGQRVLYKVFTENPISLLLELDQEKLREGITVDSEEELSNELENYIS